MSLRGNLQDFHPSELLQFLNHSGKTGTLRVYDEDDAKYLAFIQGQVNYVIHQRPFPRLNDLILYRDPAKENKISTDLEQKYRWDDVLSRALSRRRYLTGHQSGTAGHFQGTFGEGDPCLGSFLLSQGRLDAEELRKAAQPEGIPENLLKSILVDSGLIQGSEIPEVEVRGSRSCSFLDQILERGLLSREDMADAVLRCSDESLAEVLLAKNILSKSEVRICLRQIHSHRSPGSQAIRLGEYLVITGQLTQRQLERALEMQIIKDLPLGEILMEQGILKAEKIQEALAEIETLRGDFSPLYPLRQKIVEFGPLSPEDFTESLFEHEQSNRPLAEILASKEKITDRDLNRAISEVVVDEICDLLLWPNASFEFLDDLSLENSMGFKNFPVIHNGTIDVPYLLLQAHSSLDQLRQGGLQDFSLLSVFTATEKSAQDLENSSREGTNTRNLLQIIDGRRSLREIRRLLPGNRVEHFRMIAHLLQKELIRSLSRQEAVERGEEALKVGRGSEALVFFRHSLAAPGDQPSDAQLEEAIQEAWRSSTRRPFGRIVDFLERSWKACANLPPVQRLKKSRWMGKGLQKTAEFLGKGMVLASRLGRGTVQNLLKWKWAGEEFLIRIGLARSIWNLRARILFPIKGYLARRNPPQRIGTLVALQFLLLIFLVILWPRGEYMDKHATALTRTNLVPSLYVHQALDPVDVPPAVDGNLILVSCRDGTLQALRTPSLQGEGESPGELDLLWKLHAGEFGDILSSPAVASEKIFLANVRGEAIAASRDGKLLWRREHSRLEPLEPTPILLNGNVAGLAFISRESVHVLSPEDGKELFLWKTGNRILTRPVSDGKTLFIGSSDNHIYRVDWHRNELLWEFEETSDIIHMAWAEEMLIYATRDGQLAALKGEGGTVCWKREFPRNSIHHLKVNPPETVCVELERGKVELLSISTGEIRETFSPQEDRGAIRACFHGGLYFFVSNYGHLGEMDPRGEILWRSRESLGPVTGWALGSNFLAVTDLDGKVMVFPRYSRSLEKERVARAHE